MNHCLRRAQARLGTLVEVRVYGPSPPALERALASAFVAIERVHSLMSFHDADSDISRLNREAADHPVEVAVETYQVLEMAAKIHVASGGLFDISVGSELVKRGLLPLLSCHAGCSRSATAEDIELLANRQVRYRRDLLIDLGGIAKGFAVDQAIDAITCVGGATHAIVNAGGDVRVFGSSSEPIHIRHPLSDGCLLPAVELHNAAIASSAAQALWSGCAQVHVNPHRVEATPSFAGVSVAAPSCMVADALTKVLMAGGRDVSGLLTAFNASALSIDWRGTIARTVDFPPFSVMNFRNGECAAGERSRQIA